MINEKLVVDSSDLPANESQEIEDMKKLHEIRGRLIHLMTIVEKIMKEYCKINKSKKIMYGSLKNLFIKELVKNKQKLKNIEGFFDFVNALNEINPYRNDWAHGIVFYKKRIDNNVPNNFIELNSAPIPLKHPYFNNIEKAFYEIFDWLQKNELFREINGLLIK